VFYELAIAQAIGRPVILLLEEGGVLPFDVQDLRCVSYTTKAIPLTEGKYAKQVAQHVQALKDAGWPSTPVFPGDRGAAPIASDPLGYIPKSGEYGSTDSWLQLLAETENAFDIMGINLRPWRHATAALTAKASAGCQVRVLLMHPDNPALRQLVNASVEQSAFDHLRGDAQYMFDAFASAGNGNPNFAVRQISTGSPHFQLARSDKRAVSILYLYSQLTRMSPLLQCDDAHPLYATLRDEFQSLWDANAQPS
jgi:hypothetical protein